MSNRKLEMDHEMKIVRLTAETLIAAGYTVGVNDGEETTLRRCTDIDKIMEHVNTTDEDYLYAYNTEGKRVGFVYFLYDNGNGGNDVMADYGTGLEQVLKPVLEYTAKYE